MKRTISLRCSSLPSAWDCPGYLEAPQVEIDPVSEPAEEGTASHKIMEQIVESDAKSLDGIDLLGIAAKYGVDAEQLKIRAFIGLKAWGLLRHRFTNPQAEVFMARRWNLGPTTELELTGHADLLAVYPRQRFAVLGDWKFGRVDRNHAQQVKGYGALTLETYQEIDRVEGFVGWLAGGEPEIEHYTMDREQAHAWLGELYERVVKWDHVYHPGEQCAFCPRSHECEALRAMARRDVLIIGGDGFADRLQSLSDRDVIDLQRRGKVLGKILESLDLETKRRVRAAGGHLPDGDGRELRFNQQMKRKIDPILARPVLEERLKPKEIADCTHLSASQLDKAVADKADRGGKKAAIEELDTALRAAGAVTDTPEERLIDARCK